MRGGTAPRPADLPAHIGWTNRTPKPRTLTGVLLATEWLDNVPLDLAEVDDAGTARYVLVDPSSGTETVGEPISIADAGWSRRWYGEMPWPSRTRLELGAPRDAAWATAVAALRCGYAITVDYGHTRDTRPSHGTLTAFRSGRQVAAVPDGSCDLTVHVAIDAVRAAGEAVAGMPAQLTTQREALIGLGCAVPVHRSTCRRGSRWVPARIVRGDPDGRTHSPRWAGRPLLAAPAGRR